MRVRPRGRHRVVSSDEPQMLAMPYCAIGRSARATTALRQATVSRPRPGRARAGRSPAFSHVPGRAFNCVVKLLPRGVKLQCPRLDPPAEHSYLPRLPRVSLLLGGARRGRSGFASLALRRSATARRRKWVGAPTRLTRMFVKSCIKTCMSSRVPACLRRRIIYMRPRCPSACRRARSLRSLLTLVLASMVHMADYSGAHGLGRREQKRLCARAPWTSNVVSSVS